MGADLCLAFILAPEGAELDWQAGHALIDFLPEDKFTTELAEMQAPDDLRAELHEKLEALQHGERELEVIAVAGGNLWVTGGMTWGDSPTELFDAITDQEPRVLDAVGFRTSTGERLVTK